MRVWWSHGWLWNRLQNHPEWHPNDAIQLLRPKRVHGRRIPRCGASPSHQWGLLRDNGPWRGVRPRDGIQNHPAWHADDAIQLLHPKRVPGRRIPQRAGPRHQWELLRDNGRRGDLALPARSWYGLQNHSGWHADDAIQLLLPKRRRL